jgi:hypothetical protein
MAAWPQPAEPLPPVTPPVVTHRSPAVKLLGSAGGIVIVVLISLLRLGGADETSKEQAYLNADKPYEIALKADIKQTSNCSSDASCTTALTRLITDNGSYLGWATSVTVPDKFKAAHAERVKGANLHDQGGRQLLSLLASPPADRARASIMLASAEDLIQQGDAAVTRGDDLFKQAGVVLQD